MRKRTLQKQKKNLNERLRQKDKAIIKKEKKKKRTIVPVYDTKGRIITAEKKKRDRNRIILFCVIAGILCFIYLPGLFIPEETGAWTNVSIDQGAIKASDDYLKNHPNDDFDLDGILNSEEISKGTNPWNMDSDGDHLTDQCELKFSQTDPTTADSSLLVSTQKKLDTANGKKVGSPYKIGNVILWADSYSSKALGSVIETMKGYHFCDFSGYAQFPEDGYAYRVKNGIHQLLEYREKENVWAIEKDDFVEIYDKKLDEIIEFKLFGNKIYGPAIPATRALEKILPEKGLIAAKLKMKIDVEPDTDGGNKAKIDTPIYEDDSNFRFGTNNISLNDYLFVKESIDKGLCVACSLYRPEVGEFIGVIYGYDPEGNFLIANEDTLEKIGTLKIIQTSKKYMNEEGNLVTISYIDFESLDFGYNGEQKFSSYKGDRISFFAASAGDITSPSLSKMEENISENEQTYNTPETNEETTTETATETEEITQDTINTTEEPINTTIEEGNTDENPANP